MISEELMELIGMCDRIIIMKDGKINGELERNQDLNENSLITMMVIEGGQSWRIKQRRTQNKKSSSSKNYPRCR